MPHTLPGACRLLIGLAAALITACGGGGSTEHSATDTSTAPAAPASAPNPGVLSTCGIGEFDVQILVWINQLRATGATCGDQTYAAAGALTWNARLTQAADDHSRDMVALNYFSHVSADGRTLAERISATGYDWSIVGENLAAGQLTVNEVMSSWRASPGHCANLLDPGFSEIGVACVLGTTGNTYRRYWTMNLARPR